MPADCAAPLMISLCVIARNEAHCIATMLESVRGLASEVVVVDTGSTDGTREIATAFGARIEQFEWCDDFAAARNVSLSLATRPWVLVLDADEELSRESHDVISNLITKAPRAYSFERHHFSSRPDVVSSILVTPDMRGYARGARACHKTHDIRLFPNRERVRFTGAVHESVEGALFQCGIAWERCPAIIYHYGHLVSQERKREKAAQYLALARRKVSDSPNDWRAWYHLGVELQNHANHREAKDAFERARSLYPSFAPVYRQLGFAHCALGDYASGLEIFSHALSIDASCALTWSALGVTFLELGHLDKAEHCFQTIARGDPSNPVVCEGMGLIRQRRQERSGA